MSRYWTDLTPPNWLRRGRALLTLLALLALSACGQPVTLSTPDEGLMLPVSSAPGQVRLTAASQALAPATATEPAAATPAAGGPRATPPATDVAAWSFKDVAPQATQTSSPITGTDRPPGAAPNPAGQMQVTPQASAGSQVAPQLLPAVLQVDDQVQTAGIGSNCWNGPDAGPGRCTQAIGIPTAEEALRVGGTLSGTLRLPVPDPPAQLLVAVVRVNEAQELSGAPSGQRWWPGDQPGAQHYTLPPQERPQIKIQLDPGLYVLDVHARWPDLGSVNYGFLVEATGDSQLLDAYPLRTGATWVYSATIESGDAGRALAWQGLITETVTASEARSGAWVFAMRQDGQPALARDPGGQSYYAALDGRLYHLSGTDDVSLLLKDQGRGLEHDQVLAWPLDTGAAWGDPALVANGYNRSIWRVVGQDDVATPAGRYHDCYHLLFESMADRTDNWFCPGTGLVRSTYRRDGHDETWELWQAPEAPVAAASLGRVAYVHGGDLWIKGLPGGLARQITHDGQNSTPLWSPSGRWLAFRKAGASGTESWIIRVDGQAARRLDECGGAPGGLAWSPVADRLACVSRDGALVTPDVESLDRTMLAAADDGTPGTGVTRLAWSLDGTWLAYTRVDVSHAQGEQSGYQASLWRVRPDGSGRSELLVGRTPSHTGYALAGWSPSGSGILYWSDPGFAGAPLAESAELYYLPTNGDAPEGLARPVPAGPDAVIPGPPGSNLVALLVSSGQQVTTGRLLDVYRVDEAGRLGVASWPSLVASGPAWAPTACQQWPCPDGLGLAFSGQPAPLNGAAGLMGPPAPARHHIYVIDSERRPQVLVDNPAYDDEDPGWSADGDTILFTRVDGQGRASLWLAPVAGGEPQLVVDTLTQAPDDSRYYSAAAGTVEATAPHFDWATLCAWWRPVPTRP